jgi:hypothetical protein
MSSAPALDLRVYRFQDLNEALARVGGGCSVHRLFKCGHYSSDSSRRHGSPSRRRDQQRAAISWIRRSHD